MQSVAAEVVKELKGETHLPTNPKIAAIIVDAHIQLRKIAQGLNFLGLADDHFSIFRFKYLQAAANYLADNAIQSERTFIQLPHVR
jgi:hypothetical protein